MQHRTEMGSVPIGPRRLNDHAAKMRVARFRNTAALATLHYFSQQLRIWNDRLGIPFDIGAVLVSVANCRFRDLTTSAVAWVESVSRAF